MIYYVAQKNENRGDGTRENPFQTIGQAALIAMPGDTVLIGKGIYREWVSPKNGGLGNNRRITYRNVEGENPVISGAETVFGWKKETGNIWSVTLENTLFGEYNPYADTICGDWYDGFGQTHHTGEVYLDGVALSESASYEKLFAKPLGWFSRTDSTRTTLYANFGETDPNLSCTEIAVRPFCFFPRRKGIHYITVSGLTLRQAATQWAPPTAFQPGLIGPHWSKGWIIENCRIHDSKCCGISLGKKRDIKDNAWSKDPAKGGAQTYTEMIFSNLADEWNKDKIGGHIIRNNEIYNCGQAGIIGCMGGAFSDIVGNTIHHINIRHEFGGAEMAGIKLHAAVDTVIKQNRIYQCGCGLWLDWQAQGAAVERNAFFDNGQDLFIEVCHGPCLVENNLFLSERSFLNVSQGTACIHNLFAGELTPLRDVNRFTLYHLPHSTQIGGVMLVYGGDDKIINNIFVGKNDGNPLLGTGGYDAYGPFAAKKTMDNDTPAADIDKTLPMTVADNLYFNGAKSWIHEQNPRMISDFHVELTVSEEAGRYFLKTNLSDAPADFIVPYVTTAVLGKAFESDQPYENRDGSPHTADRDYSGNLRNTSATAGPMEKWPQKLLLV